MAPRDPVPSRADRKETDIADDPLMGRLKSLYDEVSSEPLPDELMRLLRRLDEAERRR